MTNLKKKNWMQEIRDLGHSLLEQVSHRLQRIGLRLRSARNRKKDWTQDVRSLCQRLGGKDQAAREYAEANADAIERTVSGLWPDSNEFVEGAGMRMTVNIASVHVPAFCSDGYKNGYDLKKYRCGSESGDSAKIRELVDRALPVESPAGTYFGAATVSGAGIRFYGDICLILSEDKIGDDTVVLDRNSYDLVRRPISERIQTESDMKNEAEKLAGNWSEVGAIATVKVLSNYGPQTRRLTVGQIAEGVLNDEDYIEILKEGSFGVRDLETARLASAEAAAANTINDRIHNGPTPSFAEITYLNQRRKAVEALSANGIQTVVVTTTGRVR